MQNIIPLPNSISSGTGKYTLSSKTAICVPFEREEIRLIGQFLAEHLRPACGYDLPVLPASTSPSGNITLAMDETGSGLGSEGYELIIESQGVLLHASQPAGLFHGAQTIIQCLPVAIKDRATQPGPWQMDCAVYRDIPRFPWRAAMLDVARHFFPVAAVKRLIDQLAYYKFNILHLHLTDDSGWRLMIHSWPRLAEFGGTTDFTSGPGGFYTQEEYRQIVEYAIAHYVTIIPEVDMPAHINSALASYSELNDSGEASTLYPAVVGVSSSLAVHKETTYRFLEDVLGEISALTPGPYLHIGGDEALSTSEADYRFFIERAQKIVQALGKRCIGWEEIIHADILPDTIVQHWWQVPLAQGATLNGHKLILSPASRIYLDMKYNASTPLGLDWTGTYIEVQDAYDWDPVHILDNVPEDAILGIEAPLWTETVATVDDMDYMFFPRLLGCGEIGWTQQEKRSWEDYRLRLAAHEPRLRGRGIKFYRSPQVDWEKE